MKIKTQFGVTSFRDQQWHIKKSLWTECCIKKIKAINYDNISVTYNLQYVAMNYHFGLGLKYIPFNYTICVLMSFFWHYFWEKWPVINKKNAILSFYTGDLYVVSSDILMYNVQWKNSISINTALVHCIWQALIMQRHCMYMHHIQCVIEVSCHYLDTGKDVIKEILKNVQWIFNWNTFFL